MRTRGIFLPLAALLVVASPIRAQDAAPIAPTSPGDPFIEEMTWTEIRDALAAGKNVAIVPVGGTEQNGAHMVMGKHNYIVKHAAGEMAKRLGNALVAPTVAWVPEGGFDNLLPGVITHSGSDYEGLLEAAARSLAHHGFTHVLFIGDSGGNQGGMEAVAERLNEEWADGPDRAFALRDYYGLAGDQVNAWLEAEYGYDGGTIGSHAGITDTSALMYVFPDGIRKDLREANSLGVRGDPTLASVEIGRMVVEFKVNAALDQYRSLVRQMEGGGRGRGAGPGGL